MPCPRCRGSGLCQECQGAGKTDCPACSGRGRLTTPRGLEYPCKSCGGEGSLDCAPECSSCDGTGEITEELQKRVQQTYRIRFENYNPSHRIVVPLLVVNGLFYLAQQLAPESVWQLYPFNQSFAQGRFWILLSPSFLHGGLVHLALNMWVLWVYGQAMEGIFGKLRFLGIYLLSAVTACSLSWFVHCYLGGAAMAGIGASGPIFGLFGAVFALHLRWRLIQGPFLEQTLKVVGLILVFGFGLEFAGYGWIDNWGHLGGLVGGFLAALVGGRPRGNSS